MRRKLRCARALFIFHQVALLWKKKGLYQQCTSFMRNHVDKFENNTRGGRLLRRASESLPLGIYYHNLREGFV